MTEETVLQGVTLHVCDEEGLTTIAHVEEAIGQGIKSIRNGKSRETHLLTSRKR